MVSKACVTWWPGFIPTNTCQGMGDDDDSGVGVGGPPP